MSQLASLASQLDPQQIGMLRALRKGALLPQLLRTYREQVTQQVHELRVAFDQGDHATARLISHTLKSASFSVGAKYIGQLCTQIEANAIKQDASSNTRLIVELQACVTALLPEIEGYLTP